LHLPKNSFKFDKKNAQIRKIISIVKKFIDFAENKIFTKNRLHFFSVFFLSFFLFESTKKPQQKIY